MSSLATFCSLTAKPRSQRLLSSMANRFKPRRTMSSVFLVIRKHVRHFSLLVFYAF